MRYLFGILCVCALGVMPLIGCSETTGTGVACEGNACPCNEAGIRAAIEAGGNDPYTFDCDGPTTVVTEAEIVIDNDVILDGEGNLTVDGDEDHAVFRVPDGVTAQLRRLTVSGGTGAVGNEGTMTLTGVTVSENSGAITNDHNGTMTLTNSTVSGNASGIINVAGTMTLTNSTVSGNGGGITNGSPSYNGTMTLTNSTVSGNASGIINVAGTITVANSTVSRGARVEFGAIYNNPAAPSAVVTVTSSVIDGECPGSVATSNGYNIESPGNTCGFDQGTDRPETTPAELNLGELADNGGPTMTHALEAGSEAINKIPADACELEEDQRAEPRPETGGTMCDVGAFERQPDDQ